MKAAIGLGSSLGDRFGWLELAVRKLDHHPGIRVLRVSRLVRTPPMRGGSARGWFLNAVVLVETSLAPSELLAVARGLEERAGRRRARTWGDRTLDVDLLHADGCVADGPDLVLPHPGIADRPFVRDPLLEVWPDAAHPVTGLPWARTAPAPGPHPAGAGVVAYPRRTV